MSLLKPRSPWPKSLWQRHYFCQLCGGELYVTVELQFDSGSKEPTVGETLTGDSSGNTGIVLSTTLESGTYAGGDAVGTVYLGSCTGITEDYECFSDDETITGSVGGADIMTANGDGIAKYTGTPYPEGQTGLYQGKRYCDEHLDFVLGKDKYTYKLRLED